LKKADYDSIAATYDCGRDIGEKNISLWIQPIAKDYPTTDKKVVLVDIGCGTGRFALPFAHRCGFDVIAVDRSRGMLERARKKDRDGNIQWRQADAESDFLPPSSCDVIFMSHLVHHLTDPGLFFKRCFGFLRHGGSVYVRYGALEHIRDDVVHRFFPRTVALDSDRTPETADIERLLDQAGFTDLHTATVVQRTYADAAGRRESLVFKGTSVQTFLSDEEHREGLARFDEFAAAHPDDPWLLEDRLCLARGRKV
jgi:ubiquinone/menaquinone biosynthesis C-methylase UbiE